MVSGLATRRKDDVMRRIIRIALVAVLMASVSAPALAQQEQGGPVEAQVGGVQSRMPPMTTPTSAKALKWTGTGLFVAGMGVAVFGFVNNQNGEFPEFGEATASNKKLGAAGITAAFAGGALMAISQRISRHAPDMKVGVKSFEITKRMSW
jgi:hypothetical protein